VQLRGVTSRSLPPDTTRRTTVLFFLFFFSHGFSAASYWLGETVYGQGELRNASEAAVFFGCVVRRQLLRVLWPRMFDSFLAGNFSAALRWTAALSHAGLAEASWDGVMMMQRALDRHLAVPDPEERKKAERRFAAEALSNYHPYADVDFAEVQLAAARAGVLTGDDRRRVLTDLFTRHRVKAALFELASEEGSWDAPLTEVVVAADSDAAEVSTALFFLCVLHPWLCAAAGAALGLIVAAACV
jgi:hypothetical protein